MKTFQQWLNEVGGTPWDAAPLQKPIDPEHPERSALYQANLDGLDKPPCKKKYGKNRFLMKKR